MTVVFLVLLVVLLSVIYLPFLSGQANFFFEDSTHFFEPLCKFIGSHLAVGQLPLWNPLNYCGMSQIAISSPGLFYPFTWLFAFMPFSQALALIMVFHQVLAGFSIYLLTLSWNLRKLSAATAGFAVALGGYFFSVTSNFTMACSAAWFCFSLFSFNRLAQAVSAKQRIVFMILSAFGTGMMISAGRPEIFAPAILFLLAFIVCNSLQETLPQQRANSAEEATVPKPTEGVLKRINKIAVTNQVKALFIGILLSMPSLLPAFEWLPYSRRSEGLYAGEVLLFSANWYDFLGLIIDQPLGDLQRMTSPMLGLVAACKTMPYISSSYIGVVIANLALWGAFAKGNNYRKLFILLLVVSLVIAAGSNLPPLIYLVEHINALSILRFPVKLLLFSVVALAVLAAFGLQEFCQGKARLWITTTFSIALLACGIVLQMHQSDLLLPFEIDFTFDWQRLQGQQLIAVALIQSGSLVLVLNLIAYLLKSKEKMRNVAAFGIVTIVVGQLLLQSFNYFLKTAPANYFNKTPRLAQLLDEERAKHPDDTAGRLATFYFYMEQFSRAKSFICEPEATANSYQYDRQILLANSNMDCNLSDIYGFEGAMVGEYYYFFLNSYIKSTMALPQSNIVSAVTKIGHPQDTVPVAENISDLPLYRFLQSGSCLFATTQKDGGTVSGRKREIKILNPALFDLIREDGALNIRLYRLHETRLRAYLSHNCLIFDDRNKLVSYMFNAEKTKFDPAQITLLEKRPAIDTAGGAAAAGKEDVAIDEKKDPDKLTVTVTAAAPSMLVLCDQFYPGWKAYVDGQEKEIYRANGFFRAVALPAGKHVVVFSYEPTSLKFAFVLVGLALLWILVIALQLWRQEPATSKAI